ncbi:MAG: hypothetical protein KGO48_17360 [Alphaproteobacteria bacterium]|nr:hypothetical protein [Alphaproteobacteria bacterium]
MPRSGPKIIVLLAIAAVVAAIYFVEKRAPAPAQAPSGGVVYINPNAGPAPSAPPAAP